MAKEKELTLKERMARIEAVVTYIKDNDLKHIYGVLKIVIMLMSGIFLTILGGFITMLVK